MPRSCFGLGARSPDSEPSRADQPLPRDVDHRAERRLDDFETADAASADPKATSGQEDEVIQRSGEPTAVGTLGLPEEAVAVYPEDAAPPERELTPLREGGVRYRRRAVPRGRAVGVQATTTTADLALLATLTDRPARWHPYRRRLRPDGPQKLQSDGDGPPQLPTRPGS